MKLLAGALIGTLLSPGCPSTITGSVVPEIVNAVDGVPDAWPHSHVYPERQEGLPPARAYPNAASAVIFPGGIPRIAAPLTDGDPGLIFRAAAHPVDEVILARAQRTPATACLGVEDLVPATDPRATAVTAIQIEIKVSLRPAVADVWGAMDVAHKRDGHDPVYTFTEVR